MNRNEEICHDWYEKSYEKEGFKAQRLYPNEELLRFLGREFFSVLDISERGKIKVLELGCGSCANLWMVAKEGFSAYGIDFSIKAIDLGRLMMEKWKVQAKLNVGSITVLPYEDEYFDVVYDVFSTYCLCEEEFNICLNEVKRVLKKNGKYFSYTPSINSDAFKNYYPARKIDEFTLDGIKRKTSPYYNNNFPFRFISPEHYRHLMSERGFEVTYLETISRTYRQLDEKFEIVTIVGKRV